MGAGAAVTREPPAGLDITQASAPPVLPPRGPRTALSPQGEPGWFHIRFESAAVERRAFVKVEPFELAVGEEVKRVFAKVSIVGPARPVIRVLEREGYAVDAAATDAARKLLGEAAALPEALFLKLSRLLSSDSAETAGDHFVLISGVTGSPTDLLDHSHESQYALVTSLERFFASLATLESRPVLTKSRGLTLTPLTPAGIADEFYNQIIQRFAAEGFRSEKNRVPVLRALYVFFGEFCKPNGPGKESSDLDRCAIDRAIRLLDYLKGIEGEVGLMFNNLDQYLDLLRRTAGFFKYRQNDLPTP